MALETEDAEFPYYMLGVALREATRAAAANGTAADIAFLQELASQLRRHAAADITDVLALYLREGRL